MDPATKRGRSDVEKGVGRLAGDAGGGDVDRVRPVGQVILGEDERGPAEGVGLDDVGPGLEVAAVDRGDDVRAGQVQVLVAALERFAAEVGGAEVSGLDGRAHGAVEAEDPRLE